MQLISKICLVSLSGLLMLGCSKEQFTPEVPTDNRIEGTGLFDFSTGGEKSFGVDFGKEIGAGALLEVFTSDPSTNVSPVFKAFLDDNGQFKGSVYLASWVETVWLKASSSGAYNIAKVNIKDGAISYTGKTDSTSGGTEIVLPVVQSNYEVLAYEDWLSHGDFDLNDVVVIHRRDIAFGNEKHENKLQRVTDYFRNINSGGKYEDAFCFEYFLNYLPEQDSNIKISFSYTDDKIAMDDINSTNVSWHSYEIPDSYVATKSRKGDVSGSLRKTFVLFAESRQHVGRTYRVERQMDGTKNKQDFEEKYEVMNQLNPFIISQYVVGDKSYDEVHVAGSLALLTERAKNNNGWADFFAEILGNGDCQFPYGLRITEENKWVPATEGIRIDSEYPEFSQWINASLNSPSNKSYNLWYRNKK